MPYRMGRGLSAKNSVFFDKTHIERSVIFSDLAWHAVRTSDVNSKVEIDTNCKFQCEADFSSDKIQDFCSEGPIGSCNMTLET